jgi:hypothetical protein
MFIFSPDRSENPRSFCEEIETESGTNTAKNAYSFSSKNYLIILHKK